MTKTIQADVAIIGGGIAGLWLLNRLSQAGYSTLLIEKDALGSQQTIASQGMIHGGLKYALGGALSGESEAIKQMPEVWKQCLNGNGEIDLRDTAILSDDFVLWSAGSVGARLISFFASKSLRGRVEVLKPADYPAVFRGAPYKTRVYRLVDVVLDVPSLITNLAAPHRDVIIKGGQLRWECQDGRVAALLTDGDLRIEAQRYVVTAGEGTGEILAALNIEAPRMQLRPLHQVIVKHDMPYSLYGHCIGAQTSASPRLTVSTHPCRDGKHVWYLGGDLATEGIELTAGQQIDRARQELMEIFPWLDWSGAEWATLYLNRAEPKQEKLIKPDKAFAGCADSQQNVIVAWPTKLSLAPDLAQQVFELLRDRIQPAPMRGQDALRQCARPEVAESPWDILF